MEPAQILVLDGLEFVYPLVHPPHMPGSPSGKWTEVPHQRRGREGCRLVARLFGGREPFLAKLLELPIGETRLANPI